MSYTRTSSNTSAGATATAAQYNNMRKDLHDLLIILFGNDSPTDTWPNPNQILLDQISEQTLNAGVTAKGNNSGTPWTVQLGHYAIPGAILMYGGGSAPVGWIICDGRAVSRTTYAALFAVISTTYGSGDGSTTFNVPNLNGKVPVGYDNTQTEFNALNKGGGEKTHALTSAENGVHSHGVNDPGHTHNFDVGSNNLGALHAQGKSATDLTGVPDHSSTTGISIQNSGSGQAHNNLQPFIVLNFLIKI